MLHDFLIIKIKKVQVLFIFQYLLMIFYPLIFCLITQELIAIDDPVEKIEKRKENGNHNLTPLLHVVNYRVGILFHVLKKEIYISK